MTAPLRTLALTCAVAVALAACKKPEQQTPPPPEVGVIDAKPQTLPLQRELVGRLSPYRSADVRARAALAAIRTNAPLVAAHVRRLGAVVATVNTLTYVGSRYSLGSRYLHGSR